MPSMTNIGKVQFENPMIAKKLTPALFSGVLIGALISACGGSGSSEPPEPPTPQNRAPTLEVIARPSVDERVAGAVVTAVRTSDADGDAVEVSVSDERFEVSGGNLKLKEGELLDFEDDSTIEITLTASDGKESVRQTITITVNRFEVMVEFSNATDAIRDFFHTWLQGSLNRQRVWEGR